MRNELKIFVPGHITGFFEIISNDNPLLKGSRGAGITLDEGVITTCKVISGSGNLIITVNDKEDKFNTISKKTVEIIADMFNVNLRSYDIFINHELNLPIGAGFGTSASFALGISNTLPYLLGINISFKKAGEIAHLAEISQSSGLGDVISEMYGGCVLRLKEGSPVNAIIDKIQMTEPTYAVIKSIGLLETSEIIEDPHHKMMINRSGSNLLSRIIKNPSIENFIKLSYEFSVNSQLISPQLQEVIDEIDEKTMGASMAMLGNTAFGLTYDPKIKIKNAQVIKINTNGIEYLNE